MEDDFHGRIKQGVPGSVRLTVVIPQLHDIDSYGKVQIK